MNKTVQYFSDEYLNRCKGATPEQIIRFLEDYRILFARHPEGQLSKLNKNKKNRAEKDLTPLLKSVQALLARGKSSIPGTSFFLVKKPYLFFVTD